MAALAGVPAANATPPAPNGPSLLAPGGVARARAWARGRAGSPAFAVVDETGRVRGLRLSVRYPSASVVKAMLLVAALRRDGSRRVPAAQRALLGPMIRVSDNDAASAVHARVGLGALNALARRAGMRHFIPYPVWGGSSITAADQARLFLRIDRLVPRRHRAYAMRLLRGVVPSQRWGIPSALPHGWRIAFKGGWGKGVTQQVDNQAALLTNGRLRVSIAVLSAGNPSDGYGAGTLRGVAQRLLRGLAGTIKGELVGVREGL